jgi:hypothetical protein
MEWQIVTALVIVGAFIFLPVAYIWYLTIGGTYQLILSRRISKLSCAIDTDCPPGHTCVGGICVPANES